MYTIIAPVSRSGTAQMIDMKTPLEGSGWRRQWDGWLGSPSIFTQQTVSLGKELSSVGLSICPCKQGYAALPGSR